MDCRAPGNGPGPFLLQHELHLDQLCLRTRFGSAPVYSSFGQPVLRGPSLKISAGKTTAIVGLSGFGKSSVAKLLLGMVDADSGQLLWDGASAPGPREARARIGYVSEDIMPLDDSIDSNIRIGRPEATNAEPERASRLAGLHEFVPFPPHGDLTMARLALPEDVRRRTPAHCPGRGTHLSSRGQPVRRATSMLDSRTGAEVLARVAEAYAGRTTIFITHRLAAARHADQVAVVARDRSQSAARKPSCRRRAACMRRCGSFSRENDRSAGPRSPRLGMTLARHGTPSAHDAG